MKIKDLQELASRLHDLNTKESEITEIRIKPTPESLHELEEDINHNMDGSLCYYFHYQTKKRDLKLMLSGIVFIIRKQ